MDSLGVRTRSNAFLMHYMHDRGTLKWFRVPIVYCMECHQDASSMLPSLPPLHTGEGLRLHIKTGPMDHQSVASHQESHRHRTRY
jgi:hypothetical protein